MTPTEFLQRRNIVAKDKTDLIIGFDDGTKESLIELLEEYHKSKVENLGLFSVSQRSELLSNFASYLNETYNLNIEIDDKDIESFNKIAL